MLTRQQQADVAMPTAIPSAEIGIPESNDWGLIVLATILIETFYGSYPIISS